MSSGRPLVFISYASVDLDLAERLASRLDLAGFEPWYAKRSISVSESHMDAIPAAIDRSVAVVVLLTEAALRSAEIPNEVAMASGKLCPLRFTTADVSRYRYALANCNWFDADPDDPSPAFDAVVESLSRRGHVPESFRLPSPDLGISSTRSVSGVSLAAVFVADDEGIVAIAGEGNRLVARSITGPARGTYRALPFPPEGVAFSPDGSVVLAFGAGSVQQFSVTPRCGLRVESPPIPGWPIGARVIAVDTSASRVTVAVAEGECSYELAVGRSQVTAVRRLGPERGPLTWGVYLDGTLVGGADGRVDVGSLGSDLSGLGEVITVDYVRSRSASMVAILHSVGGRRAARVRVSGPSARADASFAVPDTTSEVRIARAAGGRDLRTHLVLACQPSGAAQMLEVAVE